MRIYVAASSAELERYRAVRTALVMLGHEVYDWSAEHRPTTAMTRSERLDAARVDLDEIRRANAVLVLAPAARSDALVEMGYALAWRDAVWTLSDRRRGVIVSGLLAQRGIFAALADEEVDSDSDALDVLRQWGEEGRA